MVFKVAHFVGNKADVTLRSFIGSHERVLSEVTVGYSIGEGSSGFKGLEG